MGDRSELCQGLIDLCYQAKWDTYRGVRKIVLMIKGLRVHHPNAVIEVAQSEPKETESDKGRVR